MPFGLVCCCSVEPRGEGEKLKTSDGRAPTAEVQPAPEKPPAAQPSSGPSPSKDGAAAEAARLSREGRDIMPPAGSTPAARGGSPLAASAAKQDDPQTRPEMETDTASVISSAKSSARSYGTQSSVGSELVNERIPAQKRETKRIQQEMKAFVKSMVRGQQMGVVSPDGQMRMCTCSLDKRLKNFVIELKGSTRKIPLSKVNEVYQGKEPEDIATPLDDLCSTLTLDSGECLTFHFPDIPAREHFAMCLQILVDGQQP